MIVRHGFESSRDSRDHFDMVHLDTIDVSASIAAYNNMHIHLIQNSKHSLFRFVSEAIGMICLSPKYNVWDPN